VLLIFIPWTEFWTRNRFAALAPIVETLIQNAYVRGAVTGIGVITTLAGLRDLVGLLFARSARVVEADRPAP
jgi:hypothetical protein